MMLRRDCRNDVFWRVETAGMMNTHFFNEVVVVDAKK